MREQRDPGGGERVDEEVDELGDDGQLDTDILSVNASSARLSAARPSPSAMTRSAARASAVNGSARLLGWIASLVRWVQSGFIYHYAIAMILGVAVLLWWFVPLVKR